MDQVLLSDGRIIRVLGNFDDDERFFGFNVYSPDSKGDREFRGVRYSKYKSESTSGHTNVLDTCEVIGKYQVVDFFDPVLTAQANSDSYNGTIWHELYTALTSIFGVENIGLLGSALSGLHFDIEGKLKNDVDFFIEGIENVAVLEKRMKQVREDIGFCDYEPAVLKVIYDECAEVYSNPNNTLDKIIARRWSGMELPGKNPIRNTMRFRDKTITTPFDVLSRNVAHTNSKVRGVVSGAIGGNLFPRHFKLTTSDERTYDVYCLWWKISSPVRDGDDVEVCADLLTIAGHDALRIVDFKNHWLHIYT